MASLCMERRIGTDIAGFSLKCSTAAQHRSVKPANRTCNEAVKGDMGLDTLKSRRNKTKLKWWYTLASMHEDS